MQYRVNKKSGDRLSILGFGCMRFPRSFGGIDMRLTESLVSKAVEGGVNYFDTAFIYPGSEEALGAALARTGLRDRVSIATKLPLVLCRSGKDFDKFFGKSLERLKTDHIDYYLLHMLTGVVQWERFKQWGIEDWIGEKKKQGRIREAGFSFHGSRDEFLGLLDVYPWDFCQIQYNYWDENFQAGKTGLKKAAERMPVIIMEPLLGGKLANPPPAAADVFRGAGPGGPGTEAGPLSPAAWALNWLWNQEEPTVVLSGMSAPAQLEENLALAEKARPSMLGEAERDVYRRAVEALNRACKIRCTGCNYCMPCPRHVNIPGCFSAYNTSFSMGFILGMQQYTTSITITAEKWGSPAQCVKCGKCESHCPQNLPIIRHLEEVRRRMEPFLFRWVVAAIRGILIRKKKAP
jgi:predicted aldo/keto reductase-like oxidoreductase